MYIHFFLEPYTSLLLSIYNWPKMYTPKCGTLLYNRKISRHENFVNLAHRQFRVAKCQIKVRQIGKLLPKRQIL